MRLNVFFSKLLNRFVECLLPVSPKSLSFHLLSNNKKIKKQRTNNSQFFLMYVSIELGLH